MDIKLLSSYIKEKTKITLAHALVLQPSPSLTDEPSLMPSLSASAYSLLSTFFSENGSSLHGDHEQALKSFLNTLEQGLNGELPASYYLLSLDPGMGKTAACAAFLRAWREAGYKPASSILVGVSTIDELKFFAAASGLPSYDFGVLTSEEEANALGQPSDLHGEARVLFTTQQMIRSRTKGKDFADASEFHYQERPRLLRLWDEDILPSAGVVLRRDTLFGLVAPLRPEFPEFVRALEDFAASLGEGQVGQVIKVPFDLTLSSGQAYVASRQIATEHERNALEHLILMAGADMLLQHSDRYGLELVGSTPALPADIAPLVVMDASGRVRTTYQLWEENRGDLVRLPGASNDFQQLNVHLWKRPAGKDALRSSGSRDEIAAAIADALARDPDGEWLILSYKDSLDDLARAVERFRSPSHTPKLHWLHWGRHRATNAFRDINNIVIVGQNAYRPADYLGLTLAASGLPLRSNSPHDTAATREGEYRHHLLQAACRASVRKASGGLAGQCNAFVITSQGNAEQMLETVFPGHNLIRWQEDEPANGQVAQAIAYLQQVVDHDEFEEMSKQALREALGIRAASNLRQNVLDTERFRRFLAANGLEMTTRTIRRVECAFDPID
ncbi:hypothetical protein OZN62_01030 [Aurantiacibacter sp. MUD11]|uniref:hypothetical protein n=1 Tax=Aurantiacibacter sp. MUD11 TaxID=3003265 RepID=UPI0022AB43B1|nr:hypothetical protein [Aurantiacibacter sp. MUD11]WAT18192.1 hypothetical protein OZN62_01030 [Aurantiacibacter sp. MUD11]